MFDGLTNCNHQHNGMEGTKCSYGANNFRTAVRILKKFDAEKFCQNLSIHSCFECNRASLHEFAFLPLFLGTSCRMLGKKLYKERRNGTLCLLEVLLLYVCMHPRWGGHRTVFALYVLLWTRCRPICICSHISEQSKTTYFSRLF